MKTLRKEFLPLIQEAALKEGATLVDTNPWMCANSICPVVANHTIMYYDEYHAAAHWVSEIAPVIISRLGSILNHSR
jgi:hypothetical protein